MTKIFQQMGGKTKGISILEMVVTLFLIASLSIVVTTLIVNGGKSYRLGRQMIDTREVAASAIRDFEKYTRGATELIIAEGGSLEYYAYLAGDNHPAPSKITFYLEDGKIYRSIISPVGEAGVYSYPVDQANVKKIASSVINTDIFTYYNDTSDVLAFPPQLDSIKMIGIKVSIDMDLNTPTAEATEATIVQLRNMKTNL